MKLFDCVELVQNNYDCVILKVKEGKEFDLICLGCFDGNEKMFRLTKGGDHTCTVWNKDGKSYSWYWGESGYTLVSDNMHKRGRLIQECIEEDFGIYIGKDKVRRSEQIKNEHEIKVMYRGRIAALPCLKTTICVHKDGEYYKDFSSLDEVKDHFTSRGFSWNYSSQYIAQTGIKVEVYKVKKVA